jgi:NAD(P)-dependent dehydrogenase (short-subunit alcohol dehydrogenase family)
LDGLAGRYADRVLVVALDVTDAAAAASAFEAAVGRFGRVDVVVNNAGYANVAPVETASEEDFRRQFETNFWGIYNVSKAALMAIDYSGRQLEEATAWQEVSASADFDAPYPVELPAPR